MTQTIQRSEFKTDIFPNDPANSVADENHDLLDKTFAKFGLDTPVLKSPTEKSTLGVVASSNRDPSPHTADPTLVLPEGNTNESRSRSHSPSSKPAAAKDSTSATSSWLHLRRHSRSNAPSTPSDTKRNSSIDSDARKPSSDLSAGKTRRRSSLEGFPIIGSYFMNKRLEESMTAYNHFAAKTMGLLSKSFTPGAYGTSILSPYEIAYLCEVFKLPVPATKNYKSLSKTHISFTGTSSKVIENVTKANSTTGAGPTGLFVDGEENKYLNSALDVPKKLFVQYWQAAIDVIEEGASPLGIDSVQEEAVEDEHPVQKRSSDFKLTSREKKQLRKQIQTPFVAGFLYGVYKLHEQDIYLRQVIEPKFFDQHAADQASSAIQQQSGQSANQGNGSEPRIRGVYFDISLLQFLATYYSQLATQIILLDPVLFGGKSLSSDSGKSGMLLSATNGSKPKDGLLSPAHAVSLQSPNTQSKRDVAPGFDAPTLPPLSDSFGNIRLTAESRCFSFVGSVSSYGTVRDLRPQEMPQVYKSGPVPLVSAIRSKGQVDAGAHGAWTGSSVLVGDTLRISKDLWKFV